MQLTWLSHLRRPFGNVRALALSLSLCLSLRLSAVVPLYAEVPKFAVACCRRLFQKRSFLADRSIARVRAAVHFLDPAWLKAYRTEFSSNRGTHNITTSQCCNVDSSDQACPLQDCRIGNTTLCETYWTADSGITAGYWKHGAQQRFALSRKLAPWSVRELPFTNQSLKCSGR